MLDWQGACRAVTDASGILLVTHRNPDGDGIGSQIGLYHALKSAGKQVFMHNLDSVPRIYRFLEGADQMTSGMKVPWPDADIDLIVSLDCGSRHRLGLSGHLFDQTLLLNIDHHASNAGFGSINLVDPQSCATGALVVALIRRLDLPVSAASASGLYVAIMTDTGNFRHSNATAEVHRITADLIEAGASPWSVAMSVYESSSQGRIHLLRDCLDTLEVHDGGRSAWLYVNQEMCSRSNADQEDTEGFVDYARSIAGIEVAVFLRPDHGDTWKASLRSKSDVDVGSLACSLGGGGHRFAAGCNLHGSWPEVQQQMRKAVSEFLG